MNKEEIMPYFILFIFLAMGVYAFIIGPIETDKIMYQQAQEAKNEGPHGEPIADYLKTKKCIENHTCKDPWVVYQIHEPFNE